MPPSESATLSVGNRSKIRVFTRSTVDICELRPNSAIAAVNGASGATVGAPPRCRSAGRAACSASSATASNGSQWSVWNDGRPSVVGHLGERDALGALRRDALPLSATVASMSQNGTSTSGIWRPGMRRAPLVDHPVVVRRHAGGGELLVGRGEERAAREPGEGREAELRRGPRRRPCPRCGPSGRSSPGACRRSRSGRGRSPRGACRRPRSRPTLK